MSTKKSRQVPVRPFVRFSKTEQEHWRMLDWTRPDREEFEEVINSIEHLKLDNRNKIVIENSIRKEIQDLRLNVDKDMMDKEVKEEFNNVMLELNTKKFPTIIEVVINGETEKYTDLSFYTSEITDNWQNFLEVIVLEYNYKLHLIIIDENSKLHTIEIRD
jgi:cobalamin biosynthesis Mg chelatase CobN